MKSNFQTTEYLKIKNLEDLKRAQLELKYKIEQKEMELSSKVSSLKSFLNPLTYIDYATSKIGTVESIISYFVKGYKTVKQYIIEHKKNLNPDNNTIE